MSDELSSNYIENKPLNNNDAEPLLIMNNPMETKNSAESSLSESSDEWTPDKVNRPKARSLKRKQTGQLLSERSPDRKRYRKSKHSTTQSSSQLKEASRRSSLSGQSSQEDHKESQKSEHRCHSCGAMCLE